MEAIVVAAGRDCVRCMGSMMVERFRSISISVLYADDRRAACSATIPSISASVSTAVDDMRA